MDSTRTHPAALTVALLLARLLQRLEGSAVPVGAEQYRSVVRHLAAELGEVAAQPALQDALTALLGAHTAAAEVYENLNYAHAGLCRTPLPLAMHSELAAREAIARAQRAR